MRYPSICTSVLMLCLVLPGMTVKADIRSTTCPDTTEEPAGHDPAPAIPYGEGLFFRIDNDSTPPSYVFGTIHLDDPHFHRLPPQFNLALLQGSRLVMETVIDEAAQETFNRLMTLPRGESLGDKLGGELLKRYEMLSEYYDLPAEVALTLKPWAATSMVGRPRPSTGRTMEDVLRETALQMGKPLHSLETMEELITAQEEQPADEQVAVLIDTICQHQRIMTDTETLMDLYSRGDLAGIAWLNEHGHENDKTFHSMKEHMLYQRTARMAERLRPHLRNGGAIIAIGALHLTGERGLLRLLEKQGYTITRVF